MCILSVVTEPKWLEWARDLQAISQAGLAYGHDDYDIQRYRQVAEIAAEIIAGHSDISFERLTGLFGTEAGYPTPKVDVRAAVFQASRLLLVRERSDGLWTLPGGWADHDESPSEGAARECLEESGYRARPVRLLAVYDIRKHYHEPQHFFGIYKLFFDCELIGREQEPDTTEIADVDFFAVAALPALNTSRVTRRQIARLFELHMHPEQPPDFD